jgi:hypothetical protein
MGNGELIRMGTGRAMPEKGSLSGQQRIKRKRETKADGESKRNISGY